MTTRPILSPKAGPIGVFDSGYGGLNILSRIREFMPGYDFIYLGDNARAPYGACSYEVVYQFTLQAVTRLFEMGCQLVILACNTATAKALRTIQQVDLPRLDAHRRVLGVIRPTAEEIGKITTTRHIGIVATAGTIASKTYEMEVQKLYPDVTVTGQACPMWVPLIESQEYNTPGADYFVEKYINQLLFADPMIDTLVLGCTHYPILHRTIRHYTPQHVALLEQGDIIAHSLQSYMIRHPEMDALCTKYGSCRYLTTESKEKFAESASIFLNQKIEAETISLP